MDEWRLFILIVAAIVYSCLTFLTKFFAFWAKVLTLVELRHKSKEFGFVIPRLSSHAIIMFFATIFLGGVIAWATNYDTMVVFSCCMIVYAFILLWFSQQRQKMEHNLIKTYSVNLDKSRDQDLGFIDFLMLETISKKRTELSWYAEFFLDYLIDKREFIKKYIAPLPKDNVIHKLFSFIVDESLYKVARNFSIHDLMDDELENILQIGVKLNTIKELKKMMKSKIKQLK